MNAEKGQVYHLWLDVAHLAPRPISLHEPIHTTVTNRRIRAFLTSTVRYFPQIQTFIFSV